MNVHMVRACATGLTVSLVAILWYVSVIYGGKKKNCHVSFWISRRHFPHKHLCYYLQQR